MVEACDTATAGRGDEDFPGPGEAARASCVRHRVLDALPFWGGCRFCTGR